jgi:hypothetical protein
MGLLDKLGSLWPVESKNETEFYVTLALGGETYQAHGPVLLDSFNEIAKMGITPKSKAILTVERGDTRFEKVLFVMPMKRFLINPVNRLTVAKFMELALRPANA